MEKVQSVMHLVLTITNEKTGNGACQQQMHGLI